MGLFAVFDPRDLTMRTAMVSIGWAVLTAMYKRAIDLTSPSH
jgi:hypothetical protein